MADDYLTQAVNEASPQELTLMLYDGAIRFSETAFTALEKKDYLEANKYIQKTKDIIREFQYTLNEDYEISGQLNTLYDYIYRILTEANIKKEFGKLDEAISLLKQMRDTWKEAIGQA